MRGFVAVLLAALCGLGAGADDAATRRSTCVSTTEGSVVYTFTLHTRTTASGPTTTYSGTTAVVTYSATTSVPNSIVSYTFTYNVTSTSTRHVNYTSTRPARATKTVPTVCGFTPVLSEPQYTAPTVYSTPYTSYQTAVPYTEIYSTTTISSSGTSTVYVSYPDRTITTGATTTTTRTLPTAVKTVAAPPVETVYAACVPNNIVTKDNVGYYAYAAFALNGWTSSTFNSQGDRIACCARCQGTPGCGGSVFTVHADDDQDCAIYLPTNSSAVCRTSSLAAAFNQNQTGYTEPEYYISNGPCGNIIPLLYTEPDVYM